MMQEALKTRHNTAALLPLVSALTCELLLNSVHNSLVHILKHSAAEDRHMGTEQVHSNVSASAPPCSPSCINKQTGTVRKRHLQQQLALHR
jgi:hypothetical protein